MNLEHYTYLINKPEEIIDEKYSFSLEKILQDYPYFQSARALNLKRLYTINSNQYNQELKVTAAYTADRTILFDFITEDNFTTIQKGLYEKKIEELMNIMVIDSEHLLSKNPENIIEHSILNTINQSENKNDIELVETKLEIGKPLDFSEDEKHSFNEWLQLSNFQPIVREKNIVHTTILEGINKRRNKKTDLIDKFIESNPKISPVNKNDLKLIVEPQNNESNLYLMTETLAKVYLEQKKYSKAIQAYQILILKYPVKKTYFADRISDIENLKNNNN